MTVTDEMVSAAIEAAWPGPEIVYADGHDSAEAMMRAALEAALTAALSDQAGGWQPIESLPRDGRYVVAFRPLAMETGDEALAIVKTTKNPTTSPQGVKHWTSRWCHPTLWMDLPAPPPSSTAGESQSG